MHIPVESMGNITASTTVNYTAVAFVTRKISSHRVVFVTTSEAELLKSNHHEFFCCRITLIL